jgi:hypothetical protein
MSIKAIPTLYKGYPFRSRLEAKWATFFDNMNIWYSYETENGYEVATGVWYLPDFRLEEIFVEVKAKYDISEEAHDKMALLVAGIRVPGVIVYGDPLDHYAVLFEPHFLKPGYRRSVANFMQLVGAEPAALAARRARFTRDTNEQPTITQRHFR